MDFKTEIDEDFTTTLMCCVEIQSKSDTGSLEWNHHHHHHHHHHQPVCVEASFFSWFAYTYTTRIFDLRLRYPLQIGQFKIESLVHSCIPSSPTYILALSQRPKKSVSTTTKPSTRKRPRKNLPLQIQLPQRFDGIMGFR